MIKRGVLGEEFFINQKNFEENESLAFQLSNALSTVEIYEILFSRNSFEKCKKMTKFTKFLFTDYSLNLEQKIDFFEFFGMSSLKLIKCFKPWNKTPKPHLFSYLSFHESLRIFQKITFFILKSQFIDLKNVKIIGRHSHLNTMSSSGGVLTK